jgi:anti-anti-sigma factor
VLRGPITPVPATRSPATRQFWVDVRWSDGTATVVAHGRLDDAAAPELSARLTEVISVAAPRRLVIDLSDVRRVDRAGAQAIISAGAELPGSGQLVIRSIPAAAIRSFQAAGLEAAG